MNDKDIASAYTDIWAELDAVFVLPPRMPGDLDYKQFMERYDCGEHVARKRMAKLVKDGNWQWKDVMDDSCHNGRIRVIRRITNIEDK